MIIPLFLPNFLGGGEIFVIALVVLILFGAKKVPEFMKGLGRGVKSFKDGMNEAQSIIEDDDKEKGSKETDETK